MHQTGRDLIDETGSIGEGMTQSPPAPRSAAHVEGSVRHKFETVVEAFPADIGLHEDVQMAGVTSLDLIAVLSQLEHEYGVILDDVFVAKGHSISSIAARIAAAVAGS
jgi:acyl carrier protein